MGGNLERDIELYGQNKWHTIDTVPRGMQVIIWEPMYGCLIACCNAFDMGGWRLKSSGNFWGNLPDSVRPTHWHPLPRGPEHPSTDTQ